MTAPTLEAERAAFEAEYCKEFPISAMSGDKFERDECGDYNENCVYAAWRLWLAARRAASAAEGVELPPKQSIDTPEFRAVLSRYNQGEMTEAQFIAYIDGRTAGAAPEKFGCHCDLEPHMEPDGCVIDENRREDCVYARRHATKEACKYWQPIKIAAAPSQMDKGREGG